MRLLQLALTALLVICSSGAADAAKRALLIAEQAYPGGTLPPLDGVVAEAQALARRMSEIGIEVASGSPYPNAKKSDIDAAIGAFVQSVKQGDTVIFFFSGHGLQDAGLNYLIPVDGDPSMPLGTAISLDDDVLRPLSRSGASTIIVLIDACRDLPSVQQAGLAQPGFSPGNAYIFFATGPNRQAINRSPFTQALIDHIGEPGERIEDIAAAVKKDVFDKTSGAQQPQAFDSLNGGIVMLREPAKVALHFGRVDDRAEVKLDNLDLCSSTESCNGRELLLRKGKHPVVVSVWNQESYTGGAEILGGHRPEGWCYSFWATDEAGAELVRTAAWEDEPQKRGPRHGATFPVAKFTLVVDPQTAKVTVTNLDRHASGITNNQPCP